MNGTLISSISISKLKFTGNPQLHRALEKKKEKVAFVHVRKLSFDQRYVFQCKTEDYLMSVTLTMVPH